MLYVMHDRVCCRLVCSTPTHVNVNVNVNNLRVTYSTCVWPRHSREVFALQAYCSDVPLEVCSRQDLALRERFAHMEACTCSNNASHAWPSLQCTRGAGHTHGRRNKRNQHRGRV